MKIYQVGGAVRDRLLGILPQDTDYVVVGAQAQEMRALGFQEVGRGFPVFLHPETKEEYALARFERQVGKKHTDFEFVFTPDVTLEEDLARRDLTCNAMAYDPQTKQLIDPFHGKEDIQNKVLRVVNPEHFVEDPLRVLRLCRFVAQLDFVPERKTFELCKQMVQNGMLLHLSGERLWTEFMKAMQTQRFFLFVQTMHRLGALKALFGFEIPLIKALKNLTFQAPLVKFALFSFGKLENIQKISRKLKAPRRFEIFAKTACAQYENFIRLHLLNASELYEMASALNIAHVCYVEEFIEVCFAFGNENKEILEEKAHFLRAVSAVLKNFKAQDMPNFYSLPKDRHLGLELKNFRLRQIEILSRKFKLEK